MLNSYLKIGLSSVALTAGLALAPAAHAQLGGVTGSVGGTVNGSVGSTVGTTGRIGANTDIRNRTKIDTRTKTRVDVPASVGVRVGAPSAAVRTRSYSGSHYHGPYAHNHGYYGYDHFHDHPHSHSHGYAQLTVRIDADAEAKAEAKAQDITSMLTFGTRIRGAAGAELGPITGITRSQGGLVTAVSVGDSTAAIPVSSLRADGDVLVTSMTEAQIDG